MSDTLPAVTTVQVAVNAPDERELALMHAVCLSHMERVKPVVFRPARTEEERIATFRMRCNTIIEHGWADAARFPDGLECDSYDATALHIIGIDGTVVMASARLVFPTDVEQLPTEHVFDLRIEPRGHIVDMGRQIVERTYTSQQHALFAALLAQCWLEAQARGYYYVCGDFTPSMIRLYRRIGLQVTTLGPPRLYWGEERIPIVQDVLGAVHAVAARWQDRA